ncbi:MAG: hypothetical protein AB1714_22100 [Acidobacteriota bacterium]
MTQSHISEKNVLRLQELIGSSEERIASLAMLVRQVAEIAPYKRKRVRRLREARPELLRELRTVGLLSDDY